MSAYLNLWGIGTRSMKVIKDQEREIFGTTHAEVGAYLLWLWGLPTGATEIVSGYDRLESDTLHPRLPAVHVADGLASKNPNETIDLDGVAKIGFIERLPEWKKIAEDVLHGVDQ